MQIIEEKINEIKDIIDEVPCEQWGWKQRLLDGSIEDLIKYIKSIDHLKKIDSENNNEKSNANY